MNSYIELFEEMGKKAKVASAALALLSKEEKNKALLAMAEAIVEGFSRILEANALDMAKADENNVPTTMLDRLKLTKDRIVQMAEGIKQVVALPDPTGIVLEETTRPNGLELSKITVPLGVIAIIYEARPNVTVDAAALCLKAGNAVILRGGKEAIHTNLVLVQILQEALLSVGVDPYAVQLVEVTDREAVSTLLLQRKYIDVVIPRGGAGLIQRIVRESSIPVIETGSGVCHTYVDKEVDLEQALPIIINAKVQRPSTCNSMETLLLHEALLPTFLPRLLTALKEHSVEVRGTEAIKAYDDSVILATEEDWSTEYNDYILSIKAVTSVEEAIAHINTYGTRHSEAILTTNERAAQLFLNAVDAAAVYVNASTRFTDGFEYGFGAEIGISTQKLHARGPMGLPALTSYKYVVRGNGQVRT